MSWGLPTNDEAELAVDFYFLLVAQVEELRILASPALATEHQRAVFADKVAARARRLRAQHPEGQAPLTDRPIQRPAEPEEVPDLVPEVTAVVPIAVEPPVPAKPQRERKPREAKPPAPVLTPYQRSQLEHKQRFEAAQAQAAAVMARVRGEATA